MPAGAQEFSDAGDAGVVVRGPGRAGVHFRVLAHGAEFESNGKLCRPSPTRCLAVEDITRGIQLDGENDERKNRQRHQQK